MKRLAAGVKLRRLESDLKFSLGEDYYTGMTTGVLVPLLIVLNDRLHSDLKVRPAFEEDLVLEGAVFGSVRTAPALLLAPLWAFMFSAPALQACWILIKGK